ncbi:unnamed protein product, partial [Nesidiocoris tenuis]
MKFRYTLICILHTDCFLSIRERLKKIRYHCSNYVKSSYNEELVHPYRNSFRNKIRASRQIVLHLNITKFRPNFGSFQQRVPTRSNQPIRTSRVNFEWLKQIM